MHRVLPQIGFFPLSENNGWGDPLLIKKIGLKRGGFFLTNITFRRSETRQKKTFDFP